MLQSLSDPCWVLQALQSICRSALPTPVRVASSLLRKGIGLGLSSPVRAACAACSAACHTAEIRRQGLKKQRPASVAVLAHLHASGAMSCAGRNEHSGKCFGRPPGHEPRPASTQGGKVLQSRVSCSHDYTDAGLQAACILFGSLPALPTAQPGHHSITCGGPA